VKDLLVMEVRFSDGDRRPKGYRSSESTKQVSRQEQLQKEEEEETHKEEFLMTPLQK